MPVVFVTGGARRLGKWLGKFFSDKGYSLAFGYNNSEEKAEVFVEELRKSGRIAKNYHIDVRDEDSVKDAIDRAINDFGRIDIFINNAGIFPPATVLENIDISFWDNVINTNLRGQMLCAREYVKHFKEGRIINIGSLGAVEIWKNRIPYNVSKAGVVQLTKALARELAPDFQVNCILPGTIRIPDEAPPEEMISPKKTPMGRHGTPEDIFEAAYFFATCTKFITAQSIAVDGGYHDAR